MLLGSSAGQLLMSELDKTSVRVVEKEASKFVKGGVVVLEKLHLKVGGWEGGRGIRGILDGFANRRGGKGG